MGLKLTHVSKRGNWWSNPLDKRLDVLTINYLCKTFPHFAIKVQCFLTTIKPDFQVSIDGSGEILLKKLQMSCWSLAAKTNYPEEISFLQKPCLYLVLTGELWGVFSEDFKKIDHVITAPFCIPLLKWFGCYNPEHCFHNYFTWDPITMGIVALQYVL